MRGWARPPKAARGHRCRWQGVSGGWGTSLFREGASSAPSGSNPRLSKATSHAHRRTAYSAGSLTGYTQGCVTSATPSIRTSSRRRGWPSVRLSWRGCRAGRRWLSSVPRRTTHCGRCCPPVCSASPARGCGTRSARSGRWSPSTDWTTSARSARRVRRRTWWQLSFLGALLTLPTGHWLVVRATTSRCSRAYRRSRQAARPGAPKPGCRALPQLRDQTGTDVLGLRALLALGDVERHLLAFLQLAEALGGDVRVVGEDVGAAAVLLDEAEALFRVEPLHGASSHVVSPSMGRTGTALCVPGR